MTSLNAASNEIQDLIGEHALSAHEMRRGLCVLEKQSWVPISALTQLWGLSNECTSKMITLVFERLKLLEIEIKTREEDGIMGVKLHDLIHDFCVMQAKENEGVEKLHARLLEGYACLISNTEEEKRREFNTRKWWLLDLQRMDIYKRIWVDTSLGVGCITN